MCMRPTVPIEDGYLLHEYIRESPVAIVRIITDEDDRSYV
jgi:hypothetical protein